MTESTSKPQFLRETSGKSVNSERRSHLPYENPEAEGRPISGWIKYDLCVCVSDF